MMPNIFSTISPIACDISNSQLDESGHSNMEVNPSDRHEKSKSNLEVIAQIGTNADQQMNDQNKDDMEFTLGSPDSALAPDTVQKPSAPPMIHQSPRPSTIARGSNQSPAARRGQSGSSPIPTPDVFGVRIADQEAAVPQQQLTSTVVTAPSNANGGVDVDARRLQKEKLHMLGGIVDDLNQKLYEAKVKHKEIEKMLGNAQHLLGGNDTIADELSIALKKSEENINDLRAKRNQALDYHQKELKELFEGKYRAARQRGNALARQVEDARAKACQDANENTEIKKQLADAQTWAGALHAHNLDVRAQLQTKEAEMANLFQQLQDALNEAVTAEEYQRNLSRAEERLVAANIKALQEKEESDKKLMDVQIELDFETKSKEEAWIRVSEVELAARQAAAEAETAKVEMTAELKKLREENDQAVDAAKQAAERESGFKKRASLAEAALKTAEKAKATAEERYKNEVAAKDVQLKPSSIKSAQATKKKAGQPSFHETVAAHARSSVKKSEDLAAKLKVANGQLRKTLQKNEDDLKAQRCEIENLEKILDEKDETIKNLEGKIEQLKGTITKLEYDNKRFNADYQRVRSERNDKEEELDAIIKKLAALKKEKYDMEVKDCRSDLRNRKRCRKEDNGDDLCEEQPRRRRSGGGGAGRNNNSSKSLPAHEIPSKEGHQYLQQVQGKVKKEENPCDEQEEGECPKNI